MDSHRLGQFVNVPAEEEEKSTPSRVIKKAKLNQSSFDEKSVVSTIANDDPIKTMAKDCIKKMREQDVHFNNSYFKQINDLQERIEEAKSQLEVIEQFEYFLRDQYFLLYPKHKRIKSDVLNNLKVSADQSQKNSLQINLITLANEFTQKATLQRETTYKLSSQLLGDDFRVISRLKLLKDGRIVALQKTNQGSRLLHILMLDVNNNVQIKKYSINYADNVFMLHDKIICVGKNDGIMGAEEIDLETDNCIPTPYDQDHIQTDLYCINDRIVFHFFEEQGWREENGYYFIIEHLHKDEYLTCRGFNRYPQSSCFAILENYLIALGTQKGIYLYQYDETKHELSSAKILGEKNITQLINIGNKQLLSVFYTSSIRSYPELSIEIWDLTTKKVIKTGVIKSLNLHCDLRDVKLRVLPDDLTLLYLHRSYSQVGIIDLDTLEAYPIDVRTFSGWKGSHLLLEIFSTGQIIYACNNVLGIAEFEHLKQFNPVHLRQEVSAHTSLIGPIVNVVVEYLSKNKAGFFQQRPHQEITEITVSNQPTFK